MAKFQAEGIDAIINQFEKLDQRAKPMIGRSLYEGAKVMADALKRAVEELPVDDTNKKVEIRQGLRTKQKIGLIKSMGITKMQDKDGVYNIKVGFDGYNELVSPRWSKGQPNAMIARSIENGTSFLPATHFIRKTLKAKEKTIEKAMSEAINDKIKKTKGE